MTYSEKLKDPRWQKKRLEILERDEFRCRLCFFDDKTLHVHHGEYHKDPWETPNDLLLTVCVDCHSGLESLKKLVCRQLVDTHIIKEGFCTADCSPWSGMEAYSVFSQLLQRSDLSRSILPLIVLCLNNEAAASAAESLVELAHKERMSGFHYGAKIAQPERQEEPQTHTQGSETVKEVS